MIQGPDQLFDWRKSDRQHPESPVVRPARRRPKSTVALQEFRGEKQLAVERSINCHLRLPHLHNPDTSERISTQHPINLQQGCLTCRKLCVHLRLIMSWPRPGVVTRVRALVARTGGCASSAALTCFEASRQVVNWPGTGQLRGAAFDPCRDRGRAGRPVYRHATMPLRRRSLQLDFTIPEKPATASRPRANPARVWK